MDEISNPSDQEILIEIRNLCVDYVTPKGIARAVNQVSLELKPRETLGLAGESGCGKSTLAFAISRLHKMPALISQGEIFFQGNDVLRMNHDQLRKFRWNEVTVVFQSAMNSLNPVISIEEQMTDVMHTHTQISKDEAREKSIELLRTVGIHPSRLTSFPHQLSGGMRQRIAIAIALALKPKLIIMDEPTTALDVVVEREIMEEIFELKDHFGFSVLFISHDLKVVKAMSHQVMVMQAGKVVESGTAQQIFEAPEKDYTKKLISAAFDLDILD